MSRTLFVVMPALLLVNWAGCQRQPSVAPHASATPEKPKDEANLAYITMPKKAYKSVGIQTTPLKKEVVQERLTLTGWIMAKPGHEVIVTAPAAGYVRLGKGQTRAPIAGETVTPDRELLVLEPVLTPLDQTQLAILKSGVENEQTKAKTNLENATKDHERIRGLHAKNLKSDQDLEQAQKIFENAKADYDTAQAKIAFFRTTSISLKAPRAGGVLALHASPGQYVAAAAPVVTIIDLQPVWVRVPVPEFDLPHVDPQEAIAITWKNGNGSGQTPAPVFRGRPAGRVSQVDAQRHTADFWYELEPAKVPAAFYKDQMVTAYLPLGAKQAEMLASRSALVYDTHGNSWLYVERTKEGDKEHRFVRQRVQLGAPIGDSLIVRAELADGERIVTHGAAVLFSREFHKTPVADDDDD